ncbi:E3 ubiquitin-protein ligase BIG BROTHER-like isoform X2 [Wolffia australiana]
MTVRKEKYKGESQSPVTALVRDGMFEMQSQGNRFGEGMDRHGSAIKAPESDLFCSDPSHLHRRGLRCTSSAAHKINKSSLSQYREMDVSDLSSVFPHGLTENFLGFFDGLQYSDNGSILSTSLHQQLNAYRSYKYGSSRSRCRVCYDAGNTDIINSDASRSNGRGLHIISDLETIPFDPYGVLSAAEPDYLVRDQEHSPTQNGTGNSQAEVNTSEAPLAVENKSKGLPEEVILALPVSKCKRWFFSRKATRGERCVICQMGYKRGEKRILLPCRHRYHSECISRWLGINRACPVCLAEVISDEG